MELTVIAIIIGIFFFGKDKVIDWAKSIGQAKAAYQSGVKTQEK